MKCVSSLRVIGSALESVVITAYYVHHHPSSKDDLPPRPVLATGPASRDALPSPSDSATGPASRDASPTRPAIESGPSIEGATHLHVRARRRLSRVVLETSKPLLLVQNQLPICRLEPGVNLIDPPLLLEPGDRLAFEALQSGGHHG